MKQPQRINLPLFREALGKPDPLIEARARATDPATSHAAANEIAPQLGAMQEAVVNAINAWPGLTATELAGKYGIGDPRVYNRRLTEVDRAGLVVRGGVRRCSVTGKLAATWWPKGGEQ